MPKLNMGVVEQVAQKLRENATKKGEGGGGNLPDLKWYTWRDGNNMLRILEPWMEDGRLAYKFFTHWQVPPDRGRYVCVEETWPEAKLSCAICEVIREAKKRNLWELIERQLASGVAYVNAVDLYDVDKGVQIVDLRLGMYNKLIEKMTERDPNPPYEHLYGPNGDITDMERGHPVIIKKSYKGSGKDQKVEYDTSVFPKPSPAHPDAAVREKWLKERYAIEKIKKMPGEDGLAAIREAGRNFKAWLEGKVSGSSTEAPRATAPAPTAAPETPKTVHPDVAAMEAAAAAGASAPATPPPSAPSTPTAPVAPPTPVAPPVTPPAPQVQAPPAAAAPAPAAGEAKTKRSKPDCFEKEWREGAAQPPKCMPCPWEVPCSASVKKAIAAGTITV